VQVGKVGKRDGEGGKRREGKVKGVVPHPKQKSGCATGSTHIRIIQHSPTIASTELMAHCHITGLHIVDTVLHKFPIQSTTDVKMFWHYP